MPIYEYLCKGCGEHFERFQKISDQPVSKCPKCGKEVERLISQTSFTLKGGGWYKDGYSAKDSSKKSTDSSCKPKSCEDCCKKSSKKKD
ncbi:MAG: zinc ribbon domain-containing protein [Deltaproteobacteria bacterium]|nr:zinc ribbon domain-containing protein [Deltaproteobacteria bacterium]